MKENLIPGKKTIAIIGGGPSALMLYKKLLEQSGGNCTIDIFEAGDVLGCGMPYSRRGANEEHITNVSGNEIPEMETSMQQWVETLPDETLERYNINRAAFNEYKVFPRLFFGEYLAAQFDLLLQKAAAAGIATRVYLQTKIKDILDTPATGKVLLETEEKNGLEYDHVIICTGHVWPAPHEGKIKGYFDSPYPPSKLKLRLNHSVALKGAALTAIDAVRTLARMHGSFVEQAPHKLVYIPDQDTENFKIAMHSLHGLLPGIRFHLEDSHLSEPSTLTDEEIDGHISENSGFLSLDFIFEKDFKEGLRKKDPDFYDRIRHLSIEEFAGEMMHMRESIDPMLLFKAEYEEANTSIRRKEAVHWKEMLAALSFAMNYPAKHLSAEDMLRLTRVLMPLISIVIAFVPQSSCEELMALHAAGRLEIVPVDTDSRIEPHPEEGIVYHYTDSDEKQQSVHYRTFINCTGQAHLSIDDFPFKGLVKNGSIAAARLAFRSQQKAIEELDNENTDVLKEGDTYFLKVPGITITDSFRVVGKNGQANSRIYIMAVPYIGGYNPDYSGLDFCEEASKRIVAGIFFEPAE